MELRAITRTNTRPSHWHKLMKPACGMALLGAAASAFSQAGDPLPRCAIADNAFYVLRYSDPAGGDRSTVALSRIGTTPLQEASPPIWTGTNPSTVAAGMRPQDGYIYAIRAASEDSYDSPTTGTPPKHDYRNDHRGLQIIRYGTTGADNLGQIVDGPGIAPGTALGYSLQGLSNFNAADINPKTGELIAGNVRTGAYLSGSNALTRLLRINVTTTPPQLVGFIDLATPIPDRTSGDFAIDPNGTFAYGIATTGSSSTWWKADLETGAVTTVPLTTAYPSFGGAAFLPSGNVAFYSNVGMVAVFDTSGAEVSRDEVNPSASSDAVRCLPIQRPPSPSTVAAVPTLTEWALLILSLAMAGVVALRRLR